MTWFCGYLCELHCRIKYFFSSIAKIKKNRKMACLLFSLVHEQTVLLCFLEIPLFFSFGLTCLNFFEFILQEKVLAKFGFKILRWINHKTEPLSNRVQYSGNTENPNIKPWVFVQLPFSNDNDNISTLSW